MEQTPKLPQIPESARPFFQEYDFKALEPEQHAGLVIERILAYGNRGEVRWLLRQYGREVVIGWLAGSQATRLPFLRYRMWCAIFDLSPTEPIPHPWKY